MNESPARHGISSILTFVTAIASWAAVVVGQIASNPAPMGVSPKTWLLVGGLSTALLTISKGAQAVASIASPNTYQPAADVAPADVPVDPPAPTA